MKVLAFLQNQWARNPGKLQAILQRHPEQRRQIVADLLFMGCVTGKRLISGLGEDLCTRIRWENASPRIGARPSEAFPANTDHIMSAINAERPDVIIAFGRVAEAALRQLWHGTLLVAPHPASRAPSVPAELAAIGRAVRELEAGASAGPRDQC